MRMYPRSEFPNERFPDIIRADGKINMSAIAMRFSAAGYPNADTSIAAACIKAGSSVTQALQLAMLAYAAKDGPVDTLERVSKALFSTSLEERAAKGPRSIYAYLKATRPGYRYISASDVEEASRNDFAGWSAWSRALDNLALESTAWQAVPGAQS